MEISNETGLLKVAAAEGRRAEGEFLKSVSCLSFLFETAGLLEITIESISSSLKTCS